ncbi:MAG: hypothetical protein B6U78_01740 [Candidatus Aenigmarchaeota archaeon ex4484_224]|nr:MAG: hypothetical protein B6U78_01740 [Candidatus Aenigmarchaeota archaeon ex4484_224]
MILLIPFLIAFFGSLISGLYDLKTTEIPDYVPNFMILFGIGYYFLIGILTHNFYYFEKSLEFGFLSYFFGFFLFVFGQWGEGDARLLAGISFLLPFHPFFQTYFPFPLIFVFNLFLVGTVYMLIYAFVFSLLRSKKIFSIFKNEIKKRKKILTSFFVLIFIFLSSISYFLSILLGIRFSFDFVFLSIFSSLSIILLYLIFLFSKTVEKFGFIKRISVKKLKEGDVLLENKIWIGLTKKEIEKLKKSGKKFVYIKEGVRFGLAFFLALIFSIYFPEIFFFINYIF